jgi:hypothetical protein
LIDATKRTTKVSLRDPVSSEKVFDLCVHQAYNNDKLNGQNCEENEASSVSYVPS